jgi:hypothetical protein
MPKSIRDVGRSGDHRNGIPKRGKIRQREDPRLTAPEQILGSIHTPTEGCILKRINNDIQYRYSRTLAAKENEWPARHLRFSGISWRLLSHFLPSPFPLPRNRPPQQPHPALG